MGRISETVKVLLVINILFYLGSMFLGETAYSLFAMFFPLSPNFHFWQLLTHMFMHDPSSIFHILLNMFMLYMFGSHIERFFGKSRFLFLYFSSGFAAVGLHILLSYYNYYEGYNAFIDAGFTDNDILNFLTNGTYNTSVLEYINMDGLSNFYNSYNGTMVGASGAIFGILMAFAVVFPNIPLMIIFIPIPVKAKYLIGGYFALNVFSAISGTSLIGPSNTAYWAHVGGAIIGFVIAYYWKKNSFNNRRWD